MNKTNAAIVRTLLLGTSCLCAVSLAPAKADPTGGVVIGGSATISSNGTNTVINQTTNKAVINWDSFSIASGGSVTFNQPGTSAFTLNRVVGSAPSTIYGSLTANGNVWLINGNGVMFGKGSQINVGGLIATTSDINDQDFWNGNYAFKSGTGAAVVNQGTIKAGKRGSVVLSGSRVDNQGLIVADTGTVVLGGASSFTVDFAGDGLLKYQITQPAQTPDSGKPGVSNSGTIKAPGGQVIMTARAAQAVADAVINNSGMISATSASVDQNGTVILDGGDGNVNVGGTIDVSGTGSGQTGGNVSITGGNVTVADNATINASGNAGGGTIKIGGGLHGDGSVASADDVTVGKATIKADAIKKGNGGTVVIWSDGRTDVGAAISARGGANGGDGGTVETSGHALNIRQGTTVDTRAVHGTTGTWLLDPDRIVVDYDPEGAATNLHDGVIGVGGDPGQTDLVTPDTIVAALATTNVRLEAAHGIYVYAPVIFASSNSLSLLSEGSIGVYASIQNTQAVGGGGINLVAGWDGVTSVGNILATPSAFGNNHGEIYLGSENHEVFVGSKSGTTLAAGAFVTLDARNGYAVQLGYHGSGGGNIDVVATQNVQLSGEYPEYGSASAMIGNGAFDGSVSGPVTGNIDIRAGANLYIIGTGGHLDGGTANEQSAPQDAGTDAWIGNVGGAGGASGNVTIVAGNIVPDSNYAFGRMIGDDLNGGDVTIGVTNSAFYTPGISADSPHTLSLLSTGGMYVYESIVNSGSGDINLVAGWDGTTLDPKHFTDPGVFGNGDNYLAIGGSSAYGPVTVGSRHGNTTVLGSYVGAWAFYGDVQIGYHGAGDGNIHLESTHGMYLLANYSEGHAYTLHVGNGAFDGSTEGDVGGNVFVKAGSGLQISTYYDFGCDCGASVQHDGVSLQSIGGQIGIGNAGGSGAVTGATTIIAGYFDGNDYRDAIGASIENDIAFGDVTVGTTASTFYTPGLEFDSSHTLSLLSTGDLYVYNSIVNAGSGNINLVAGWDGSTLDPAHFRDAGVFGNEGTLSVGGTADGILVVGSRHGGTNLLGGRVEIGAYYSDTQIGYHGAGDGNIDIASTGDIDLVARTSESNGSYHVHIGNGAFDDSVEGNVGGNITIEAAGTLNLQLYAGEACAECLQETNNGNPPFAGTDRLIAIGNAPGYGTTAGTTAILVGSIDDQAGVLSANIAADLDIGDVTVGVRNPEYSLNLNNAIYADSAHTLNLLSSGDIFVGATVENSGSGAINLVAGWDGVTLDPSHFGDEGVFGNGSFGAVSIGGKNVEGNVSVGTAVGDLKVFASGLHIEGDYGFAQLGFHGTGGGDIYVKTTHDITVDGRRDFSVIGNGGSDVEGDVGGDISLFAGGQTAFFGGAGDTAWLGNIAGGGGKATGNVTALTSGGFFNADFIAADLGTTADTGGNVFIGFHDLTVGPVFIGGLTYNSAHDFTFASAGTMQVTGLVQNAGSGAVTLAAGWDGETVGSASTLRAAGAFGLNGAQLRVGGNYTYGEGEGSFSVNQYSNVAVGSAGGTTTLLGGDIVIAPASGFYAQVGYHGATGSDGGKIVVDALGDLTLQGGTDGGTFAAIGNGAANQEGAVSGDIDISVGGTTTLTAGEGQSNVWIGNLSLGAHTGNVRLVTGYLDADGNFSDNLASDLDGGDVTIAITASDANSRVDGALIYDSSHTLTVLTAGNLEIDSSIQNSGTGAINLVAGWDGHTFDSAHFADEGVYGNDGGNLFIRGEGAEGSVAVGSQGATNVYAASVTLFGSTGAYAQIGYHGATGGDITVHATGGVSLSGAQTADGYAFVGNGTSYTVNTAGGAVTIHAGSIDASGMQGIAGSDVTLSADSGGIGDSDNPVRIAANNLSVTTFDRDVYLVSPNLGVNLTNVSTVVDHDNTVEGATFSLDAGGSITQSGSIRSGVTNIATTSGNITLTDPDNGFGAITVAAPGNVSLTDYSMLTIAGADVDGKLTLVAGTSIGQTGAISAGALDATANDGTIILTGAKNSFAALAVHTTGTNAATVTDSGAVALGASSVGGVFTLHAGGAITQTGALHTGDLDVSADISSDITLTNSGNSLGQVIVQTGGNAALTDSGSISLVYANVGNKLTLTAGQGSISQFSSSSVANSFAPTSSTGILAAALDATATGGSIVLTNANNAFGALAVHTDGSNAATIGDSTAVTVGATSVGGLFTLAAGGAIAQSGSITANGLTASTTSGGILLTNTGNAVQGTVALSTPAAASLYNTLGTIIGTTSVNGDLTLLSKGNVTFNNSVQDDGGKIAVVAGWDGTTTDPAAFGNSGVYGNNNGTILIGGQNASGPVAVGAKTGTASFYASYIVVGAAHAGAQLGYHGTGGGDIVVRALHDLTLNAIGGNATLGNGSRGTDITGNVGGNIDIRIGGNAIFNSATGPSATFTAWLGNVARNGTASGNLLLVMNDSDGTQDHALSDFAVADIAGGDVTFGFTGAGDQGPEGAIAYNSSHTLTVLTAGNFGVVSSLQNSGSGAITIVAGWDGHTLDSAHFGDQGVYGNDGKGVIVGTSYASGNAALGSAGGTTSIYGASLIVAAVNGYAQLGFSGHGSGGINVTTTGGVTLSGGNGAGQFAQIGNGGLGTSGNNAGAIVIAAGGDVTLTGGTGQEAYVQIGHGGAESNSGAQQGYSNVAPITITAANVVLNAGGGTAAYVQIGNGGYKSGLNIAGGTATNGGDITVTVSHAVSLTGSGPDAYAQIGNGGSMSNSGAAAAAGGTDSGNIIVQAPNGPNGAVTVAAGTGNNAYAQIGNGGYAVNSGPNSTAANWTVTGDIHVTDLALNGGGPNGYGIIGNGDASHNSFGNISGDITIDANGQITYQSGTGPHAPGTIGNFTGQGTTSGQIFGAQPPPDVGISGDPVVIGVANTNTATNSSPTNTVTVIQTVPVNNDNDENGNDGHSAVTVTVETPGPLAALDQSNTDGEPHDTDSATVIIADSLNGAAKPGPANLLGGLLKSIPVSTNVHGVPSADQDFSSWGNEALWQ